MVTATATTLTLWSWRLKECSALATATGHTVELCRVTIAFRWYIFTFCVVTLASLLIQVTHTPYALPGLSCTVAATAATLTLGSWRLKECSALASAVNGGGDDLL